MKKEIIVRIMGGLGNQMFQYALGRNLSLKTGAELKLDTFTFSEHKLYRTYSLNHFNITEKFASKDEVTCFKKYNNKDGRIWFLYNRLIADPKRYVKERQFNFDPRVMELKPPFYLDGYWQTEKYFAENSDIIRREFSVKATLEGRSSEIFEMMKKTESVSVHIRRADFVTNKNIRHDQGDICDTEYYRMAGAIIAEKVRRPTFFVFSDDPEWAEINIKFPHPTIYVTQNGVGKDYEDMRLMSSTNHNIIANSSFSWWGAWLNKNPRKIVIAPKKWFNIIKFDTRDITPPSWIRI